MMVVLVWTYQRKTNIDRDIEVRDENYTVFIE